MTNPTTLTAAVAFAAYLEPQLEGRRVIVFGSSQSPLSEALIERGARLVHVYDPDATRTRESAALNTNRNISIAPLGEGGSPVRDGAFDVAIVENLSGIEKPAQLLVRVRRSLSPGGIALIASPNPDVNSRLLDIDTPAASDVLGYYELYDGIAAEFDEVRMVGQTPFVGYALVDFAPEGDVEISVDSGFVPSGAEEPDWFVALAGQQALEVDPFSVIQLPCLEVLPAVAPGAGDNSELLAAQLAAREANERAAGAESQLKEKSNAQRRRQQDDGRQDELQQKISRLQKAVNKSEGRNTELEGRLATSDARAEELESAVSDREHELKKLKSARPSAPAQSKQTRSGAARSVPARSVPARSELDQLETLLQERGAAIRALEVELAEAVRVAEELIVQLDTSKSRPAANAEDPAALREKLNVLAATSARDKADRISAEWTASQLLGELETLRRISESTPAVLNPSVVDEAPATDTSASIKTAELSAS